VSTKTIAEKAHWVYTVDIDPWVKKNIVPGLPKNATFYNKIGSVKKRLDAAFIDSLHTYEQCSKDIVDAKRIVKPGGLIMFHDTRMKQIQAAIFDSGLECVFMYTVAGIAIGWNR
jgi:hypothetical protein